MRFIRGQPQYTDITLIRFYFNCQRIDSQQRSIIGARGKVYKKSTTNSNDEYQRQAIKFWLLILFFVYLFSDCVRSSVGRAIHLK